MKQALVQVTKYLRILNFNESFSTLKWLKNDFDKDFLLLQVVDDHTQALLYLRQKEFVKILTWPKSKISVNWRFIHAKIFVSDFSVFDVQSINWI